MADERVPHKTAELPATDVVGYRGFVRVDEVIE